MKLRRLTEAEAGLIDIIRSGAHVVLMFQHYPQQGWVASMTGDKDTHAGFGKTFQECWDSIVAVPENEKRNERLDRFLASEAAIMTQSTNPQTEKPQES